MRHVSSPCCVWTWSVCACVFRVVLCALLSKLPSLPPSAAVADDVALRFARLAPGASARACSAVQCSTIMQRNDRHRQLSRGQSGVREGETKKVSALRLPDSVDCCVCALCVPRLCAPFATPPTARCQSSGGDPAAEAGADPHSRVTSSEAGSESSAGTGTRKSKQGTGGKQRAGDTVRTASSKHDTHTGTRTTAGTQWCRVSGSLPVGLSSAHTARSIEWIVATQRLGGQKLHGQLTAISLI